MSLPPQLQPKSKSRVIDLVAQAGIDVSDWPNYKGGKTNPGANPKYCYEWALKEPGKVIVCNLWFSNMKEVNGNVEQHLALADTPPRSDTDPTRRARRRRMSALLAEAARDQLPVRVIVLDGKARSASVDGKTHVKYRQLDTETWSVTQIESVAESFVVRRCSHHEKFVDQFELQAPADGPSTKSFAVITVRGRSREIRQFALRRALGSCEYCGSKGFRFPDGRIYLETHHIVPLSLDGPDSALNVAALCANHHREAHHGGDADSIRTFLLKKLRGDA